MNTLPPAALILGAWCIFCLAFVLLYRWTARARFLDRILAHYGYTRQPTEMIVFPHQTAARFAGFRGSRHPGHRALVAWWPGCGMMALCGRPPQRVTISREMERYDTGEGPLGAILRRRQMVFGDDALWMEV